MGAAGSRGGEALGGGADSQRDAASLDRTGLPDLRAAARQGQARGSDPVGEPDQEPAGSRGDADHRREPLARERRSRGGKLAARVTALGAGAGEGAAARRPLAALVAVLTAGPEVGGGQRPRQTISSPTA